MTEASTLAPLPGWFPLARHILEQIDAGESPELGEHVDLSAFLRAALDYIEEQQATRR